jgi:hypothetical protein
LGQAVETAAPSPAVSATITVSTRILNREDAPACKPNSFAGWSQHARKCHRESVMIEFFNRWEQVWNDGQFNLAPSCVANSYIRHDANPPSGLIIWSLESEVPVPADFIGSRRREELRQAQEREHATVNQNLLGGNMDYAVCAPRTGFARWTAIYGATSASTCWLANTQCASSKRLRIEEFNPNVP